ncbi:hypothetical protein SKAU_G00298270 [Synaphobranchus kaupii]|uniref:Uncharacterized protein n=1 Tax=Synaphobranchus kaupii TaxID=118154 RepID=A0A9Q1EV69_SYNKA|nr:hypothetical protein SKAU_G00298270 [Synaphobranchus kaupii]
MFEREVERTPCEAMNATVSTPTEKPKTRPRGDPLPQKPQQSAAHCPKNHSPVLPGPKNLTTVPAPYPQKPQHSSGPKN